jgi:shikimate dehydrogenase
MTVALLGAGGAARSVAVALAAAGARSVVVINRTAAKAAEVAALAGAVGRVGEPADVALVDLVVNSTSVGMGADAALPCDVALLSARQVVADLVYHPLLTPLLRAAAHAGATPVGGLGMLVHQAARQLRLWTGCEPPIAVMDAAARATLTT